MPARINPDARIQDILVVDRFDDIRLVISEKHNRILRLISENELTVSEIAKSLEMNPGSAHYRLKELEEHRLVRQVREEIKGGIVKKYYRSAAKRIVIESPDFSSGKGLSGFPSPDYLDRLIRSIEYLGYQLPPENMEDAKDLLTRYDKRIKSLMIELQSSGLDGVENNGFILDSAYLFVYGAKARNDPELIRLYDGFEKLFIRYE